MGDDMLRACEESANRVEGMFPIAALLTRRLIAEVRRLRLLELCLASHPQTTADPAALEADGFVDPPARHSPPGAASQ